MPPPPSLLPVNKLTLSLANSLIVVYFQISSTCVFKLYRYDCKLYKYKDEHRNSGRLEPVNNIKDIDTLAGNFRAMLLLHSLGNSKLAGHLKESPSNATYLSPGIQNDLITLID